MQYFYKICIMDDPPEKMNDGKTYVVLSTLGKIQLLWWSRGIRCELRIINKNKHEIYAYI